VLFGDWPAEIPHDVLGLTYTRHWRLLSTMANPTGSVSVERSMLRERSGGLLQLPVEGFEGVSKVDEQLVLELGDVPRLNGVVMLGQLTDCFRPPEAVPSGQSRHLVRD
jgi:hypothetical protein